MIVVTAAIDGLRKLPPLNESKITTWIEPLNQAGITIKNIVHTISLLRGNEEEKVRKRGGKEEGGREGWKNGGRREGWEREGKNGGRREGWDREGKKGGERSM